MVERKGIISGDDLTDPDAVNSWPLPSLNRRGKVIQSAKRESEARAQELVENVSKAGRPRQLTAEEINKISKQAEEEGFKAGYEEGFSKGEVQGEKKGEAKAWQEHKAKLEQECARLSAICDRLSEPMQVQDEALEQTLLDLIKHFAGKLIQKEIEQNPEILRSLILKVIQALPAGSKNMSIFLHPDDAALMEKYLKEKNQQWPIQMDDSLTPGGCRVETRESIVDYSIEKRWLSMLEHTNTPAEADDANDEQPR